MKKPVRQRTAAAPATPAQLATYGHVAARLRAELEKREWKVGDFNEAMGAPRGHPNAYNWVTGKTGLASSSRTKVAKVLKIPETELMPRSESGRVMTVVSAPIFPSVVPAVRKVSEVLGFSVTDAGEARIRLDVTLPLAAATPLLRMLLDAGLVLGAHEDQQDGDHS